MIKKYEENLIIIKYFDSLFMLIDNQTNLNLTFIFYIEVVTLDIFVETYQWIWNHIFEEFFTIIIQKFLNFSQDCQISIFQDW